MGDTEKEVAACAAHILNTSGMIDAIAAMFGEELERVGAPDHIVATHVRLKRAEIILALEALAPDDFVDAERCEVCGKRPAPVMSGDGECYLCERCAADLRAEYGGEVSHG